jgi:hypothetical protein
MKNKPRKKRDCFPPASRWFLARLILRPWRCRRHILSKRWSTLNGPDGVISQQTEFFTRECYVQLLLRFKALTFESLVIVISRNRMLVSSTHLGPKTRFLLLSDSCGFVDVGRPRWREERSVVYNCYWPSPAQLFSGPNLTGLITIFYCLRFETPPKLEGRVPLFISLRNRVTQVYTQAICSLFVASDSQGYGGGSRTRHHAGARLSSAVRTSQETDGLHDNLHAVWAEQSSYVSVSQCAVVFCISLWKPRHWL